MKGALLLVLLAATNALPMSAVYSRYASGRPRLVVKATRDPDALLLLRYADVRGAKPRVVARDDLDAPPFEVSLQKVIDAKDIVVEMLVRRPPARIVDRIVGNRFVRISDGFGEAIDLDGDGVPEVIFTGYNGQNECGVRLSVFLQRWNGKRFEDDDRRYVDLLSMRRGTDNDEIHLSATKRYAVRLFGPGRFMLDDEEIKPGRPFKTEEDCHSIELRGGTAKTRAFLEELP